MRDAIERMHQPSNKPAANPKFNPFPGLRPFGFEESHLFFGREGQSEEVLRKLARNRFVAVVGASGSGKSSLMYCGVTPILHGGFIASARSKWRIVTMRPGGGPLGNLARALVRSDRHLPADEMVYKTAILKSILSSSSMGIVESLKYLDIAEDENILLQVDQFEELFRFKTSGTGYSSYNESLAFVKMLLETVEQTQLPIYVILTMRSDFVGECSHYQELTKLINDSHYLIPQMTRDDFQKAIVGPVAVGGGRITDRLVHQLLNDVGDNPDQLPIMQHALMRTWDYWINNRQGDEPLDINHYIAIGRMEKALSEHANEAYNELDERGKYICEKTFKALTEVGADNRGIRHPSSVTEVAAMCEASTDEVIAVVETFRMTGRSFLSPFGDVYIDSTTVIDISHESLMRIWDKLKIWVSEEAAAAQMYLRLAEASEKYQDGKIGLWNPPDLHLATAWRDKQNPNLVWAQRHNPAFERTMVYLATSEREYEAEEQNKIRLQKRALQRSRIFALILGIAAVVALGIMLYAMIQSEEAKRQTIMANDQKRKADSLRVYAEQDRLLAKKNEERAIQQSLLLDDKKKEAEQQRVNALQSAAYAIEQKLLADKNLKIAEQLRVQADSSATVAVLEKQNAENASQQAFRQRMLSIAQSMAVKSLQINRPKDKEIKALVSYQAYDFNNQYDGIKHNNDMYNALYFTVKMLNGDNTTFNQYVGHTAPVRSIVFSPSGNNFYSTGSDGMVYKWIGGKPATNPTKIYESKSIGKALAISPDNVWLALGGDDRTIYLFKNGSTEPVVLNGHTGEIREMDFTTTNKLYSASADSSILEWDLNSFNSRQVYKGQYRMRCIDVSPDDKHILAGDEGGNLWLWTDPKSQPRSIFNEPYDIIYSVAFNNTGTMMAAGDLQGLVRVWEMKGYDKPDVLGGHNARIAKIMFSPNDSLLATSSYDGNIMLWQTDNFDNQPIVLNDDNTWVMTIAFSNDSKKMYTGFRDNTIKVWDTNADLMARQVYDSLKREMATDEWNKYVARDIPQQTILDK